MNIKFKVGDLARGVANKNKCAFIKKINKDNANVEDTYVFYLLDNPDEEYVQYTQFFDKYHEKPE